MKHSSRSLSKLDAIVLGAGFGGLYMLHKLRSMGFKVLALEAAHSVGGAWYWNRYPGARCDVESLTYSYSFSPELDAEWRWSEKYAAQEEIARYLEFVCDRLDLRRDIRFGDKLLRARFDKAESLWAFETEQGKQYLAQHFVSAAGPISAPIMPNVPARDLYQGEFLHTALWPRDREPDFRGKRVAVIGTGSSGTQVIPMIAEQAEKLSVLVRTPNYYSPARNRTLNEDDYRRWSRIRDNVRRKLREGEMMGTGDVFMPEEMQATRTSPGASFTREERRHILEKRWELGGAIAPRAFSDVMTDLEVNDEVSDFLREKIGSVIEDPETARVLTPRGFAFGTKRITVGTDFLETFNRDNVEAIDIRAKPIERFTNQGLVIGGREHVFDAIVAASGFDALTGALTTIDVRNADGLSIKEAWSSSAGTYLGLGVAGFPNLHLVGGPGSPSVLVNVVMCNEFQVEWISELLDHMRKTGFSQVEVKPSAQAHWSEEVNEAARKSVLADADSWYVGTNVPGKPRGILAYAGGIQSYIAACNQCKQGGYRGLTFRAS